MIPSEVFKKKQYYPMNKEGIIFMNTKKIFTNPFVILCIAIFSIVVFTKYVVNISSIINDTSKLNKPTGTQLCSALAVILQFVSLIGLILVFFQVKIMNGINRMDMSYNLYKENVQIRQLHQQANLELNSLNAQFAAKQKSKHEFDDLYAGKEYKHIKRFAFHFEYLGYLVKSNKVHFALIFDPITFPDFLIENSEELRRSARLHYPDFWEGLEYLYYRYKKERRKSYLKRVMKKIYGWKICLHPIVLSLKLKYSDTRFKKMGLDSKYKKLLYKEYTNPKNEKPLEGSNTFAGNNLVEDNMMLIEINSKIDSTLSFLEKIDSTLSLSEFNSAQKKDTATGKDNNPVADNVVELKRNFSELSTVLSLLIETTAQAAVETEKDNNAVVDNVEELKRNFIEQLSSVLSLLIETATQIARDAANKNTK